MSWLVQRSKMWGWFLETNVSWKQVRLLGCFVWKGISLTLDFSDSVHMIEFGAPVRAPVVLGRAVGVSSTMRGWFLRDENLQIGFQFFFPTPRAIPGISVALKFNLQRKEGGLVPQVHFVGDLVLQNLKFPELPSLIWSSFSVQMWEIIAGLLRAMRAIWKLWSFSIILGQINTSPTLGIGARILSFLLLTYA